MLNKDDIHKQNMNDMLRISTILAEILRDKEELMTDDDHRRINYCSRVMKNVREKEKILNTNFK